MTSRIFALAALSAVALAPAAYGMVRPQSSEHPQTTDPPPLADIQVKITDTRITLNPSSASRGAYARFIVHNVGTKTHSFTLGTAKRGTGVQTGFTRTVKPKAQKILLLYLDYRGRLPYYSSLPADRSKPGMKGTFTIL